MLIVLTYDVNVTTMGGEKRLRKVAKICESYGVRVQNSVFELLVDNAQLIIIKGKLLQIIDEELDSIRFYNMGSKWERKIEFYGKGLVVDQGNTLIL